MEKQVNKFDELVPGIMYHMSITEKFLTVIDISQSEFMKASNKMSEAMTKAEADSIPGDDQSVTRNMIKHIRKAIEDDEVVSQVAACMTLASISVGFSLELNKQGQGSDNS